VQLDHQAVHRRCLFFVSLLSWDFDYCFAVRYRDTYSQRVGKWLLPCGVMVTLSHTTCTMYYYMIVSLYEQVVLVVEFYPVVYY